MSRGCGASDRAGGDGDGASSIGYQSTMPPSRALARIAVLLAASVASMTSTACFLFDTPPSAPPLTSSDLQSLSPLAHRDPTSAEATTSAVETPAPRGSSAPAQSNQDKLGTPMTGVAADAAAPRGPAPFDAAKFVGKGSAGNPPDGFLPYPKTLKRDELSPLGRVDRDDDDEDDATALDTVYPTDDKMYERVRLFYARSGALGSVTIRFYASDDPARAIREMRAALEKRYGKGTLRPDGATDEDFDRILWRSPRMRLALDESNLELELMY